MTGTGLITYKEAAALLGLKDGTLYAMVSRKSIPHVRLSPRIVRFDRAELEAWISANSQLPRVEVASRGDSRQLEVPGTSEAVGSGGTRSC